MKPRVLVADDNPNVRTALRLLIESEQMECVAVTTPAEVIEHCRLQSYDVVLVDLNYSRDTTSGNEGLALIDSLAQMEQCPAIIAMTGWSTVDVAVEAMKRGASDFVTKPWDNGRLLGMLAAHIRRASESKQHPKQADEPAPADVQSHGAPLSLVAESERMKSLVTRLEQIGRSAMNVLFTGENGTGKSLFAERMHQASPRRHAAFVAVNMGAIPDALFESEMFGHVKGAFTDARSGRIGRFELADGGTIFLDEISNLSLVQQAKLLRVIEQRSFEKVGSSKTQSVDVRIVAATNLDLCNAVVEGRFRLDLLYRLNTVTIDIAPLRERVADIEPLARHFLRQHAQKYQMSIPVLSRDAVLLLQRHRWPGNVRELSHVMECALFLRGGGPIGVSDLHGLAEAAAAQVPPQSDYPTLEEAECTLIERRLHAFKGDAVAAARSLGLSRSAFYRRLEKYSLVK